MKIKRGGMGCVETALILVLIFIVLIVTLSILDTDNKTGVRGLTTFQVQATNMAECLRMDKFTRQECIDLIGAKTP